jgi:deoxyribose-phosphate aldolase
MDHEYRAVAKLIDHSLLRPTLTDSELEAGCAVARHYDVASVCIVPHALARCAALLSGSSVQPSTTIGFPHGAQSTRAKVAEAQIALADGGTELDMVVNIGKVLGGDHAFVRQDIGAVLQVTRDAGQKLKVIFENCYLEQTHKLALCAICSELGVDWIKTSTGFGSGGATLEDLRLMLEHARPGVLVKAAGGVRTLEQVLMMRDLGVSRIGSSNTQLILAELRARLDARLQK